MALPRELAAKLGKPIRLLASGSKGEAFAALCAIARLLEAYGQSFHGAFRNTDGTLEWSEVALFCQRQKHRLPEKHHEFVDDMASRTVYGREPTPKQHQYLHSLFYKLGGKIT